MVKLQEPKSMTFKELINWHKKQLTKVERDLTGGQYVVMTDLHTQAIRLLEAGQRLQDNYFGTPPKDALPLADII